jgi:hypothetical protein
MGLVIGLTKGEKLWFNDIETELVEILGPMRFKLKVISAAMDKVYEVTNKERTEILPNVLVSSGPPTITSTGVKLNIDAPQNIYVKRDKVKRREEALDERLNGNA